jgi:hypothetical protein
VSDQVYPSPFRGLAYSTVKTPTFSTLDQQSSNRSGELLIGQDPNPIWRWKLIYEVLFNDSRSTPGFAPYTDLQELMGFFLARSGQFDDFLYDDVDDDFAGPPTWARRIYFPAGTIIIDPAGHGQKWSGGVTGSTIPTFNDVGGPPVNDGGGSWTDQGAFPGASAQAIPLVSDATNPVSAAVIGGSAGTGFAVGDYLGATGGGGTGAVLQVATLSGSAIATFNIISGGSGYTTTAGAALTVLTGSGTGSPTANITATTLWYSPLQRNLGGFLEDVTDLNVSVNPLRVWANGVAKTVGACGSQDAELHGPGLAIPGYSFAGKYLKWCAAPTGPITAAFNFYFRVRFASDQQDFEKFVYNLWTIGGSQSQNGSGTLELVTHRAITQ